MTINRILRAKARTFSLATAPVGILACVLSGSSAIAQQFQNVTLRFAAEFAGKPFDCSSTIEGVGATKVAVTPIDFRLYVSEIRLVRADGALVPLALDQDGKWQSKNLALLDFENASAGCVNGTPETRSVVTGQAPIGDYKGVRFTIGVPFEMNHQDPTLAASPLNLTSMFWTWQGGYKFIKIDFGVKGAQANRVKDMAGGNHSSPMKPMNGGERSAQPAPSPAFAIHLGSTLCKSDSRTTPPSGCTNPNRMEISFDTFDLARNVVVFDPAPVLVANNVEVNTPETSPGCMSFLNDPECNTLMPRLGFDYGEHKAQVQSLVRIR
jgi:uncharacterized repeat protein (TIGR04052 family)